MGQDHDTLDMKLLKIEVYTCLSSFESVWVDSKLSH